MTSQSDHNTKSTFDIAIIGAGLSGLLAALAACSDDHRVLHIAPKTEEADSRTTALLADSISYLQELKLWEALEPISFPLRTMRIIDATKRLIRAPQVDFRCQEVELDAFGYNFENVRLAEILNQRLAKEHNYSRIEKSFTNLDLTNTDLAELTVEGGETFRAKIILAADGRNSPTRQLLEIGVRDWSYPQVALVGNFTHSLPHGDISTEFHTETGPFTLVPLGNNRSSLVCVVAPEQTDDLKSMSLPDLNLHLEQRMESILGKVSVESGLKSFPLSGMTARQFGKGPVMLIGEAAHVFPPIGAQGLNLGLRDIRSAIEMASRAQNTAPSAFADIGQQYHQRRNTDIQTRTASVDLLNRSLLSDFLPVQLARSAGLYTLGTISPLRRLMMREGVAPGLAMRRMGERLKVTSGRSA